LIKIDSEWHDYEVLKASVKVLKNKLILIEYHYDNMKIKNNTLNQTKNFLIKNPFKKDFKTQSSFGKIFDYVLENTRKF
jgi:hypothetical protein